MSRHQHDENANDLWHYFQDVIRWVRATFTAYRKEMKGLAWGPLYNEFGQEKLSPTALEGEIQSLMVDEDVTKKSGIYPYVLNRQEKHLNIRAFTPQMKREAYERQKGVCSACGEHFDIAKMEADHIMPWSEGGRTWAENCQMLCREDNRRKGSR